jgi:hypothetical protein
MGCYLVESVSSFIYVVIYIYIYMYMFIHGQRERKSEIEGQLQRDRGILFVYGITSNFHNSFLAADYVTMMCKVT